MQIQIREAFKRSLKLRGDRIYLYLFGLCCISLGTSAPAQAEPAPIERDPPLDRAHPASGQGLQFTSNGELVNAMLYLPAGVGPHPAVILLHGLPGNEQNLDLARAMQRAGWAVITFHYRGSWGSGGKFTLSGGCAVVGHSYGGFVASCASRRHPELGAIGLIAPWDISYDAREFAKLSPKEADGRAFAAFNDVDGRLEGATALSLMRIIRTDGAKLRLTDMAPALGGRPLLLAAATRDDPDDQAGELRAALEKSHYEHVTYRLFDTDHGFNDQRIALTSYLLNWLATLPMAPKPN
jgi:pimeloyl-ACP methyl ester carboxylesterase